MDCAIDGRCRSYAINSDAGFTLTLELDGKKDAQEKTRRSKRPPYVPTEPLEYQTVDSETIKSEVPDGVENSSLQTATVEGNARGGESAPSMRDPSLTSGGTKVRLQMSVSGDSVAIKGLNESDGIFRVSLAHAESDVERISRFQREKQWEKMREGNVNSVFITAKIHLQSIRFIRKVTSNR